MTNMDDVDYTDSDDAAFDTTQFDAEETVVVESSSYDAAMVAETMMLLDDAPALELPVWEPTGDAEVDAALEQLRLLDDADLADHVAVFTDVHAALHQRLSDIASS